MNQLMKVLPLLLAGLVLTAGCKKDEEPTNPGGGGGITSSAFPNNAATLSPGGAPAVGQLTGGTPPYSINTAPNAAVATAELSGANSDTLTITPVGEGTTSVVIEDNSTRAGESTAGQTVTINITVIAGGGSGTITGSGTFSVSTSEGNFSAQGTFDENATSGQGVGGLRTTSVEEDYLAIYAYNARSLTDIDLAIVAYIAPGGTLATGTFSFTPSMGNFATFVVGFGVNLDDPNAPYWTAISGTSNLATLTPTNASGTGSGSGFNTQTSQPFTFEGMTFSVTGYGTGAVSSALEENIKEAVTRIAKREIEARKNR